MTQHNSLNLNLFNSQLYKSKSGVKICTEVTLSL